SVARAIKADEASIGAANEWMQRQIQAAGSSKPRPETPAALAALPLTRAWASARQYVQVPRMGRAITIDGDPSEWGDAGLAVNILAGAAGETKAASDFAPR